MNRFLCCAIAAIVLHAAAADAPMKATLSATANVPVIPDTFVVVLTLKEKGPDTKTALEMLASSRKAALDKLTTLGGKEAVEITPPRLAETADKENPMTRAMRMAQGNNKPKKKKPDGLAGLQLKSPQHPPACHPPEK